MMRIQKLKILWMSFIGFISILYAGNGDVVGNGGDVVVTKDSLELLDIYEFRAKHALKKLRNESADYKKILNDSLRNLSHFDAKLAKQYQKRLKKLEQEIVFLEKIDLANIKDSQHIALPKGSRLKQVAHFKDNDGSGEVKLYIDKTIWNKLDAFNKAALILHEIIFEHFRLLGEKNSIKARKLTGKIMFSDTVILTKKGLIRFFQKNQLSHYL